MNSEQNIRTTPSNELDLTFMTTENVWGKNDSGVNNDLLLSLKQLQFNPETKQWTYESKKNIWASLSFLTRDLRLSNLSGGDINKNQELLSLAHDLLLEDYYKAFIICIGRVASNIELNQSRKGFLRKLFATITHEYKGSLEPEKRSMFTGKSKTED